MELCMLCIYVFQTLLSKYVRQTSTYNYFVVINNSFLKGGEQGGVVP